MDVSTGWNFNKHEDRREAEEQQDKEKPLLMVGSPVCKMFSMLWALCGCSGREEDKNQDSVGHVELMFKNVQEANGGSLPEGEKGQAGREERRR